MSEQQQKGVKGVFVTNEQVRLTGSPNVARFLAQCLYWSGIEIVKQRQGWFYKSRTEWQAETWLSRYQQEKAREQLRGMGLLEEKHERLNTGIRLWFRLNTVKCYALLNSLAGQPGEQLVLTENNSDALYDSSLSDELTIHNDNESINDESITETKSDLENKTNVPNTGIESSPNPENGTNVLENNITDNHKISNDHCVDSSPLDPQTYLLCHPFIYQFVCYCEKRANDQFLKTLEEFGFESPDVQDTLFRFIDQNGHKIINWHKKSLPLPIEPLTRADIDDAIRVSTGGKNE